MDALLLIGHPTDTGDNTDTTGAAVMDKLKAFESFVSVATRGSLTAAAKAEEASSLLLKLGGKIIPEQFGDASDDGVDQHYA